MFFLSCFVFISNRNVEKLSIIMNIQLIKHILVRQFSLIYFCLMSEHGNGISWYLFDAHKSVRK